MLTLTTPGPWLVASGIAAGVYLAWAWRVESARRRPGWRRAALALAAVSAFLLVARPARETSVVLGSALLLTGGAEGAVAVATGVAEVFALPGAEVERGTPVADLATLVRRRPELRQWRVAGVGLEEWQLAALPGEVSWSTRSEPRAGIERAFWRRQLALGELLAVSGAAPAAALEARTLTLTGPAGIEATVELGPDGVFEVTALPRREGRFLYRLEIEAGGEPQAAEVIDVVVGPRRPPRILWLEGSPSFASREVKRWLRDLGGAMVLRTQVSRGRFRYEYLNQERVALGRLSEELLGDFDVMVADGAAWSRLAESEREALRAATQSGLGLLFVPGLPPLGSAARAAAPFETAVIGDLDTIEVELAGPAHDPLAPLVVPAREFLPQPGQRALFADRAGRVFAVSQPSGLGELAASLVEGSERWVLRGEAPSHHRYWGRLLSALARSPETRGATVPAGPLPIDEACPIEIVSTDVEELTVTGPDGERRVLAPAQDVFDPRTWHATVRPRAAGWHRLAHGDATTWFYAQERDAWLAWRDRRALEATDRRVALGARAEALAADRRASIPLPRWLFFGLLLIALTAIWADEQWRRAA